MAFVRTVPEKEAEGAVKAVYEEDQKGTGYIQNYTRALSLRPQILSAYRQLSRTIRSNLDERRYELITTVVAARLRCSY